MIARIAVVVWALSLGLLVVPAPRAAAGNACSPTRPDALGPFYAPNAPVRSSVGKGFVLSGTVRSARDCRPLGAARVEFWLAGPAGQYGDTWRATVVADREGRYRFESHFPPPYSGRPSHIHVRVAAPGHQVLVTQYYPQRDESEGRFDLVLMPE
jgi:protocatechuate 3,4-dioxygenase beta subunit